MRTRYLQVAVLAGLAVLGVRSSAQSPQTATEPTTVDGPMVMRMVLTKQANRPFGPAGYGTLSDILPLMWDVAGEATLIDEHTASFRGYTIRLTRSLDRLPCLWTRRGAHRQLI